MLLVCLVSRVDEIDVRKVSEKSFQEELHPVNGYNPTEEQI